MRNLLSTKVTVILVLAVLLTAALAVVAGVTNQSLPNMIVQGAIAPFRAAGTNLMGTVEKYYSYMFRYEALAAENEARSPLPTPCPTCMPWAASPSWL